jgi:hypothetical protein
VAAIAASNLKNPGRNLYIKIQFTGHAKKGAFLITAKRLTSAVQAFKYHANPLFFNKFTFYADAPVW